MNPEIRRLVGAFVLVGGVIVMLGGCATHQPAEEASTAKAPPPPRPPARWEALMLPDDTAQELGDVGWAWWDERRDGALAMRSNEPLLATSQWPEPARPSLDRPRYIFLPRRADTILYFQPE